MARPLRIEYEGAVYHVIARGNERKAVFRDGSHRERYLRRQAHYRERFGFRLYAFCLESSGVESSWVNRAFLYYWAQSETSLT